LALIIGAGVFFVSSKINQNTIDTTQIGVSEYFAIAPSSAQAPYIVQTTSRVYYVAQIQQDETLIILQEYYFYDEDSWQHSDLPIPLNKQFYGDTIVYQRKGGQ